MGKKNLSRKISRKTHHSNAYRHKEKTRHREREDRHHRDDKKRWQKNVHTYRGDMRREHNNLYRHKEHLKIRHKDPHRDEEHFRMKDEFTDKRSIQLLKKSIIWSNNEEKTSQNGWPITIQRERGVKRASSPKFYDERSKKVSKFYTRHNLKKQNLNIFWRKGSPFSQFFTAFFSIKKEKYICTEQYMMAEKARLFGDNGNLANIMKSNNPTEMKSFGRQVEGFNPDIWNMCCRQIVQDGNRAKFTQNETLLQKLLETNEEFFAEANPFDKIWGIGMTSTDANVDNPSMWRGTNWLGESLNQVKFQVQSIVYTETNKMDAPQQSIGELFQVGLCDWFEKMGCDIKIDGKNNSGVKHKPQKSKYNLKRIEIVSSRSDNLKRLACQYIVTDWTREEILDSPSVLALFMRLKEKELEAIPGYFTCQFRNNYINSCMSVSKVLKRLHREFRAIQDFVGEEQDWIRRYACTRERPCKPQMF